ncbi:monosaccharide ABC transporter membrane protein (CUT2 family) [Halanaerobium saccharolyticum]|uniref:Monosaccharide ABC transporter membrane protein (CUT2 family) n=1 Tax=Halanaerobium saccharolyticum TaxID=43595 RepID=A0A4R6M0U6_9FIRM|nr:ABC transporter permease [Halanaerobium saccharolyticum]TDO93950.1 monosaccharide ABC transporter membrane protein (CUT2 family) [Halanaerobium saccharolyticum]
MEKTNNDFVKWKNIIFEKFGAIFGLLFLVIALSFLSPYFLTVNNITNVLQQASINALVASGMLLAILTAGIDLSVGSVLALAISIGGISIVNYGINPVIGILIVLAVGAAAGLINGLLLTKLNLPHPFISTLAMMNVARGLALIVTDASPVSGLPEWIQFIGNGYIGQIPFSFILVIAVAIFFHFFLNKTTLGRHIYAVGGNPEAARLSGIDTKKVLTWVYTISGIMAGMGGIVLMGRVNAAYPNAGLMYELDAIAAVIIGGASFLGGVGTIWGTLIGAMIIAVIRNGLNLLGVAASLQTVVLGIVIIVAVYIDVLRRKKA